MWKYLKETLNTIDFKAKRAVPGHVCVCVCMCMCVCVCVGECGGVGVRLSVCLSALKAIDILANRILLDHRLFGESVFR